MATEKPFVVAVTPIRNRAWIVEDHVAALSEQPISGTFYLTGDNEDTTLEALEEWLPAGAAIEVFDTNSPHWSRDRPGEKYTGDDHASLARVYNRLIDRALALFPESCGSSGAASPSSRRPTTS